MDQPTAWACLLSNLTALPGLGSLIAGRRSGWAQAALALIGFALTTAWAVRFVAAWIRTRHFPEVLTRDLWLALIGIGLFAVAWFWGLATGLSILRAARRQQPE